VIKATPEAISLLEGAVGKQMKIIDMDWALRVPFYTIHCSCDTYFSCDADWRGLVKCPKCEAEASMRKLALRWQQIKEQK